MKLANKSVCDVKVKSGLKMDKKKWKNMSIKLKVATAFGMTVGIPILLMWYILESAITQTWHFIRVLWYDKKKRSPEEIDELEIAKSLRLDDAKSWELKELK